MYVNAGATCTTSGPGPRTMSATAYSGELREVEGRVGHGPAAQENGAVQHVPPLRRI